MRQRGENGYGKGREAGEKGTGSGSKRSGGGRFRPPCPPSLPWLCVAVNASVCTTCKILLAQAQVLLILFRLADGRLILPLRIKIIK